MDREEAIRRIRAWNLDADDLEVLGAVIPELRESEDENLKNKSGYYKAGKFWKASTLWKATKDKIPQKVPNRYILQECTWNISSLQHFADEVKNVQEVNLDYPIILDMNGNILDGAHRVVKAYLEDRDIDIVYLGDDEWPEPDYDEEKAVKESEDERIRKAIITYLSNELHNVKQLTPYTNEFEDWIAYLEKQKEPVVDKEGMYYYLGGEFIYCGYPVTEENPYDFAISQQEKQKEQKPDDDPLDDPKFLKGFDTGREVQRIFDEQKPAEPSDEELQRHQDELYDFKVFAAKQAKEHHISFIHDFEWNNFCAGILSYFNEQKPEEKISVSEELYEHIRNACACIEDAMSSDTMCDMTDYLEVADSSAQKAFDMVKRLVVKQPAEWSEEDEKFVRGLIRGLTAKRDIFGRTTFSSDNLDITETINWLKSLPKKFALPPKSVEWSEEDEDMFVRVLHFLNTNRINERGKVITWVESLPKRFSLQPKQEWSENDTVMCNAAIGLIRTHPNLIAIHGVNKSSIIKWLQSFRPRRQGLIDDICSKAGISIPYLDKNQWCILKGDNIQSGVVGFGDTKEDALVDFIKDVPIPQQWSEGDEKHIDICIKALKEWEMQDSEDFSATISWLKSLRPQMNPIVAVDAGQLLKILPKRQEWSKEEEMYLLQAIETLEHENYLILADKLRSLRPSWKPSEEQMEALESAQLMYAHGLERDDIASVLKSLYEQLKKL